MYDAIVFSGGGTAAAAFVGCLLYLEHVGMRDVATTFVGTSAGAIVSLLCTIGMSAAHIRQWIEESLRKDAIIKFGTDLDLLLRFADRLGISDGESFMDAIRAALVAKDVPPTVTFIELAKLTGKNLVVCASNLTEARAVYWSVDTSPDMSVVLAVRMSIGIPILYTPVAHEDGCLYVDGALFNHCPVDCILHTASRVLALDIDMWDPEKKPSPPAKAEKVEPDLFGYFSTLIRCVLTRAHDASTFSLENCILTTKRPVKVEQVHVRLSKPLWEYFSMSEMAFDVDDGFVDQHVDIGYRALRDHHHHQSSQDDDFILADKR